MTMPIQGQTMQIVSTGGVIYMKGLPRRRKKPWVKIDPKADDPLSQMFAGMTGDMGDPRQLAKALEGTKATVVSSAADATTYDVTIDPSSLLGGSAAGAARVGGAGQGPATPSTPRTGPTSMAVDVQGQSVKIVVRRLGQAGHDHGASGRPGRHLPAPHRLTPAQLNRRQLAASPPDLVAEAADPYAGP